jgi:hypothetical protein
MHISRTYTALYTVLEAQKEVRVLEIVPVDEATSGTASERAFWQLLRGELWNRVSTRSMRPAVQETSIPGASRVSPTGPMDITDQFRTRFT